MRSTKDLKGIVQHARGRMNGPIKAIHDEISSAEQRKPSRGGSTTPMGGAASQQDNEYNFVKSQKVGGANYASVGGNDEDAAKKLRKLEVLAAADKDTIETQTKKMHGMRAELEQLKIKYGQLKRNYDSVSLNAQKNSENSEKILQMKEQYESRIAELTIGKKDAEEELKTFKSHFTTVEQFGKD